MDIEPSFLIAKQRSGTQLIRSILSSNPQLIAIGEKLRKAFLMYWHERAVSTNNASILFPNKENIQRVLLDYMAENSEGKPKVMLDVKYNQINNLNLSYQKIFAKPYLFDFIEQNNYPVVHLIRENPLTTAISILYARQTKVYKVVNVNELPSKKVFNINIKQCNSIVHEISKEIEYVRKSLKGYTNYVEVFYDDLVNDYVEINPATFKKLAKFLELENIFEKKLKFVKIANPMNEMIENYNEFHDFFSQTKFSDFLLPQ